MSENRKLTITRRRRPMVSRGLRLLLVMGLTIGLCVLTTSSYATLIFDSGDQAFVNATLESFDPGNAASGARSFTITRGGVQFTFSTQSTGGIFFCDGNNCRLRAPAPQGIEVSIDPPVSAIGFQHTFIECPGRITFNGSLGSETFEFSYPPGSFFVGASNLGLISSVHLESTCPYAEEWDDLRFVPSGGGGPSPTPTPTPVVAADLALRKDGPAIVDFGSLSLDYSFAATNSNQGSGSSTATDVRFLDFLPPNVHLLGSNPQATVFASGPAVRPRYVAAIQIGDVVPGQTFLGSLQLSTPPFISDPTQIVCDGTITNVGLVTGSSIDSNRANNLSITTAAFNKASRTGFGEICFNGVDDNCDGRADCADPACACLPVISAPPMPPFPFPVIGGPPPAEPPSDRNAGTQHCLSDAGGHTTELPPACCDPNMRAEDLRRRGIDCTPHDPNFKEADPPTNRSGYGYTEAGRLMTYTVHYENDGGADAHDVSIIDVLDSDLDESTLVIRNGGTYNATTRAIVWNDPVLPPHTPRTVTFSIAVRSDAPEQTRVRNVGTIIFPDANPPSRVDTNFVEHVVVASNNPVLPNLTVVQCSQTGADEWRVKLVNEGFGFAYGVSASIINPPSSVNVIEGASSFSHYLDANPQMGTLLPLAFTLSNDTVRFTTRTPGDPCGALIWRIRYEDAAGNVFVRDVQNEADQDRDGVADARDNCPAVFNPWQADANHDGTGDACEPPPPNSAPDCSHARPSIAAIWPPNHKKVEAKILGVTDRDGDKVSITIDRITQDEPTDGGGDGDTCPDAGGLGSSTALLRAERRGGGNGRVYTIFFTARDSRGASCSSYVKVSVPHDQNKASVDDGPRFDATVCSSRPRK